MLGSGWLLAGRGGVLGSGWLLAGRGGVLGSGWLLAGRGGVAGCRSSLDSDGESVLTPALARSGGDVGLVSAGASGRAEALSG